MNNNKQQQHQTIANTGENPFRRSSVIVRSPQASVTGKTLDNNAIEKFLHKKDTADGSPVMARDADISEEMRHLTQLRQSEERTFIELGNKLSAANVILAGAKNIHKTLRDNVNCALALYQQLREYKEAISINPMVVSGTCKEMQNKATQVEQTSPVHERKRKVAKTPATVKALQAQEEINNTENPVRENGWQRVSHRKSAKKKDKRNVKIRELREKGEAITIKANTSESYADVIKKMKNKINPTDIGVEIQGIRRTRTGELLVTLRKGEGQAEKLKSAIGNSVEGVMIKTVTKTHVIDIRDMDESTDAEDLVRALMEATKVEEPTTFKVLNLRTSFGRTKQAIVQLPEHLASQLLNARKIRVGWIMCRLRSKIKSKQCFRCLEQGHIAYQCKAIDRSNLCRKCCNPGHRARECKTEERCILCFESGSINVRHYIGSTECVKNRRNKTAK